MITKLHSIRERWQWQNAMPCRFERRNRFALIFLLLFSSRKKVSVSFWRAIAQNACTKIHRDTIVCIEFVDKHTFSVDPKYNV